MHARLPIPLQSGDTVRLVSPSSPLSQEKLTQFVQLLEGEGYRVEFGEHTFDSEFYLAGSDQDRAKDLMDAFLDPDVQGVLCTRGGYGAARLYPYLDLGVMAASGKLFAGFSDITSLHIPLNNRGLATLHAPMGLTLSREREPWVIESFLNALKGDFRTPATAAKGETVVGGKAKGEVTGGCMILVCDSLGTTESIDLEHKILLLEDVDEPPHRVDAMLTHLINTTEIQKARGIVVGEMTRTDDKWDTEIGKKEWREIVVERLEPLGLPMILNYPFGHAPAMLTLPLGIVAELDADAGTLTYETI